MQKYFKTISLALFIAVLFVIFSTSSVFADDGGTAEGTPVPTETGGGEGIATEEPFVAETPEAAATEPAVAEPLPAEIPTLEETPIPEEFLPLDGDVILADGEGDPLVLASEETAQLLQGGDPYFMVGTQKYAWVFDQGSGWQSACPAGTVAGSTCFEATGTGTIAAVLTYIDTHGLVPTDKKIYVEAGVYDESVSGVFIDGTSSVFLKQLNGLIGVNGAENTVIIGDVSVTGTVAGFTLSGFTIKGGVTITSVTGSTVLTDLDVKNTAGNGVIVQDQRGAVTITDVKSSENAGIGLLVDNSTTTTAYPVTITNSEVNDNEYDGTLIFSNGAVTVNGISSSRNVGDGLVIETKGAVTVKNGVFSNNTYNVGSSYYEEYGVGLYIHNHMTTSAVTLENIQATGNEDVGIWVRTIGPVTVKNVTAVNNLFQGLLVADDFWVDGTLTSTTVSISDSVFKNNASEGLRVHAKGNVILSYVNATNNSYEGALIDTCLWDAGTSKCLGAGTVTILNPNKTPMDFSWNGAAGTYDGLLISSAAAVTMTGITARGNSGSGLYVVNNFPGKICGVTLNPLPEVLTYDQASKFSNNGSFGVEIFSNGPVAINGYSAYPMSMHNNSAGGINIGSNFAPSGSTVKITGVELFNTGNTAVVVYSKAAITIDSVWVDNSWNESYGGYGFNLNNTFGSGAISISNASANYVDEFGFYITSKGAVTLTSVSVYQPGQRGIYIDNQVAPYAQPVKLTDVTVERAHGNGIEILSKGTVTLSGVSSFNNSGMMLPQYQSIDLTGYAVEQTWFNFLAEAGAQISITMNYTGYGTMDLYDASDGTLIWSDMSGYWSDTFESGVLTLPTTGEYYLSMQWGSDWQEDYTYMLNYRYNVTIPYANSAPYNNGIYIDNTFGSADVIIQGSGKNPNPWVSNNTNAGVFVRSAGNIKLLNTMLHRNYRDGATLDNSQALSAKTVTAGSLDIFHSGWVGLRITSIGAVAMSNISSNENGTTGIEVVNCILDSGKCKGSGAVSLTGTNAISNNGEYGLNIYTIGLVTLNNIDAYGNADMGVYISAPFNGSLTVIPTSGGVTMTSSGGFTNSIGNTYAGTGLYIYTYGAVSLTNLNVYENNANGIQINNRYAASNKPVTLTNVSVSRSGTTGIDIKSRGTVTINGVSSTANAYKNAAIDFGETIEGLGNGYFSLSFDVPEGAALKITFTSDGFRGDVQLFDEYWNWLGSTTVDSDDPETINAGIVSAGTYTLEMWSWYTTPFWYRLSVSDIESIVDHDYCYPVPGITIDNTFGTGDVIVGKSATGKITSSEENTGYGLGIFTNGNVKLASAYVSNNYGQGIYVNSMTEAKTVTITDITVTNNRGNGITVSNLGAVTWTTGLISDNGGNGVVIDNISAIAAAPITVTKVKVYGSDDFGLIIYGKGAVNLTDVEVVDNRENGITVTTYGAINLIRVNSLMNINPDNPYNYGAYLDNTLSTSLTPAAVNITDSNFNYNTYGLYISSKGTVSLKGVDVEGNYDRGHNINLNSGITANLPGYFETYNAAYGWVYDGNMANWNFTVTEVDYDLALTVYLDFNGYWELYDSEGNYIYNNYVDVDNVPHYILQPGDYRIQLIAFTNEEYGGVYHIGLNVDPDMAFPSSYANGAEIYTKGNVTVARSTARATNNFNRNGWNGLRIYSEGTVALSDIKANENLYNGVYINNPTPGKPVTISRMVVLENYYRNAQVYTLGAVSWNTGESSGSLYGVSINNNSATTPQVVTISKVSFNEASNHFGLEIYSAGNVSLTSVGATWNRLSGIYIDNTAGTGSVIVNNTTGEWIGGNESDGLNIRSRGTVTLTNVGTGMNSGNGIYVYNEVPADTIKPGVTLTYTLDRWVDSNGYWGIDIHSTGPIKLTTTKKLYIEFNGMDGVMLNNSVGGVSIGVIAGGVQATSTSKPGQIYITNHSGGSALVVYTQGAALLSNIYANNTLYHAIWVGYDYGIGRPSSVKLTNVVVEGAGDDFNHSDGIHVYALGPVIMEKIQAYGPYGDGLDIYTTSGIVTVKKSYFRSNGSYADGLGLKIVSFGDVVLDSIIANMNDNNLYVNTTGSVTLLGTYYKNQFNDSYVGDSITIYAGAGGITLNRLDVINNNGGVFLSTTGKLTINNALLQNNMYGISSQAGTGAVFNKVTSMNNGIFDDDGDGIEESYNTDGIFLQLTSGTASFTDSVFIGNTGSGIEVYFSDPAIIAKPYPLTLLRTLYFGNDSDYTGDLNLYTRDS